MLESFVAQPPLHTDQCTERVPDGWLSVVDDLIAMPRSAVRGGSLNVCYRSDADSVIQAVTSDNSPRPKGKVSLLSSRRKWSPIPRQSRSWPSSRPRI